MKKAIFSATFLCLSVFLSAQSNEWKNPEINQVNRAPMHSHYFAYENEAAATVGIPEKSSNYMSLNGTWNFNWVKDATSRPMDFWKTSFDDKSWATIQVPGIWEHYGYGDLQYVNGGYPWRNQFESNPPLFPEENNHVGSYRREINLPANWKGKTVLAHFGSVTSNMYRPDQIPRSRQEPDCLPSIQMVRRHIPGRPGFLSFERCCQRLLLICQKRNERGRSSCNSRFGR